ncbi:cadherin-like beta sandwich domain-containing protein [Clostridium chromiireducens]|uniref:Cadherin-like beta sandwich domain protein n=1 Tax=Clostridium chromiireducens TaxID=225345 RepID=A0A1V4IJ62_9CLOT|nr:cadherin-like beta sandwich domain-containing protein [Clostridium chromiireducens]OPJ59547.1 cadherin-like beta sandwich domain protein [Clostridium chromiireducens]
MNKNIKKIIAMSLLMGAFSMIEPVKYLGLTATKAYASDNDIHLKSISVSGGDSISLSDGKTTYKTYVSRATEETTIRVRTEDDSDKVTIDGENPDEDGSKTFSKSVELEKGKNTFEIKVQDSDGDNQRTYTVAIYRGDSTGASTQYDDIYLKNIILSDGEIDFSKDETSYDINVAADVSEIKIKAEPEDNGYTVTIDNSEVDEDDKYREDVSLNKGKNTIYIEIVNEDDDEERLYTLNIYRGAKDTATGIADNDQDPIYLDDIRIEDGTIKYTPTFNQKVTSYSANVNESYDNIIVKAAPEDEDDVVRINGDKVDSNSRKRVYLNNGKNEIKIKVSNEEDYDDDDDDDEEYDTRTYTLTVYRGTSGATTNNPNTNIVTKTSQWVNNNGKWQYNDALGNPLKNMWFLDKSTGYWYYLDANGDMKTGWLQDSSGNWYYLYQSGAMAYNTVIDGYKLGASGAWSK